MSSKRKHQDDSGRGEASDTDGKSLKKVRKSKDESTKNTNSEKDVKRDKSGKLIFDDVPDFKPNLTPKEVMQLGSFGGTYFRPIKSGVTGESYKDVWKEFPSDWFEGLSIPEQVASSKYRVDVNKYKVKCGGSLEMWESSGWMRKQDPYGWFQWYCRFYLGRRSEDDERQVKRWLNSVGPKGRWKNNLIAKCVRQGAAYDNAAVSPVIRQVHQHWAYVLTKEDFDKHAPNVKK